MTKKIERELKLAEVCKRISMTGYIDLKSEFNFEFEEKIKTERENSIDLTIESRIKKYNKPETIDENGKKTLQYVIDCLKNKSLKFESKDVDKLQYFTKKINTLIRGTNFSKVGIDNRMNLIKNGENGELRGHSIDLVQLFNEIKSSPRFTQFLINSKIDKAFIENGTFLSHIRYLYSICKNCEDGDKYPLFYKQWQLLALWFFGVPQHDYDAFTNHYLGLSELGPDKLLNFSCYYYLLTLKLKKDAEYNALLSVSEQEKRIVEELIWADKFPSEPEQGEDDEYNLEQQIMEIREKFKNWLDSKTDLAQNTINQYKSQIDTVNDISVQNKLGNIFLWNKDDWASKQELLLELPEMYANSKKANPKGSGVYSACLSKLKEFHDTNIPGGETKEIGTPESEIGVPPILPFPQFCWYWANTGVFENCNDPLKLFVICKSIEQNGNGQLTYTTTFKDLIESIAIANGVDVTTAYDWSYKARTSANSNLLLDAGSYWFNLQLICHGPNPSTLTFDTLNSLSDINVFKGLLKERIKKYELPNYAMFNSGTNVDKQKRIQDWSNYRQFIYPFKIIAKIFKAIESEDVIQRYLTSDDLCRIIIPLSAVQADTSTHIENILRFRSNPSDYALWSKPQDSVNNGERMANEYLRFLEFMGLLTSNKPDEHRHVNKKYQLAAPDSLDFLLHDNNLTSAPLKATDDSGCKSEKNPEYKENKIYFGAPGTGKSYEISQLLKQRIPDKKCRDKFAFRVTFHPEYDHASFVGGYKPYSKDGRDIEYKFVPQIFTNLFVKAVNDPDNQYYLVIEEINRGNCAEIFGDLFQLLDRNKEYSINPSKELADYLNGKDEEGNNIIKRPTVFWENGEKMLLPDNITLWATMNTSDQSLMPMDSAFKRRWEWKYVPINYEEYNDEQKTKKNESFNYLVKIGDNESFSWIRFIETVNYKISKIESLGMDKCLGNYFVQVNDGEIIIPEDIFINKVLFYLWNDVFKDENDEEGESIFKGITFMDFFPKETARKNIKKILEKLDNFRKDENTKDPLKMKGKIYDIRKSTELNTSETKPELDNITEEKSPE
ncbi:MAG: hypothetical protein FJX80_04815 [Bacteroidetes bacterium]|nr:hypothetical protein [Bacteroidota bacterium]